MPSCRQGHAVSPGQDSCQICGDDVRIRCTQGHANSVGSHFCETCGDLLLFAQPAGASGADPAAFEYTSGSFTDFIGHEEPDDASAAAPADATEVGSRRGGGNTVTRHRRPDPRVSRHDRRGAAHRAVPPRRSGPPSALRLSRRDLLSKARLIAAVVALVVLAAVGAFALNRHNSPPKAGSPLPSAGRAGPASSSAASSPPAAGLGRWSSPALIGHGGAAVTGLSCPRPSACYVVDTAGKVWFGAGRGGWRVVAADPRAPLAAIACPTVQRCMALDRAGYALIKVRGTWQSLLYIDSRGSAFSTVSCPTTRFCMTADSGGNAFSDTAGRWRPFTVDPQGAALTGLACTSASHCLAVSARGVVFTYHGSTWSGPAAVDAGHAFTGVSCASAGFCVAVDDAGNAAVYTGGRWHVAPIGIRAKAVACPAKGVCVAAGRAGKAAVYQSRSWTVTSTRVRRTVGQLSCPRVNSCVAADRRNVMTYHK